MSINNRLQKIFLSLKPCISAQVLAEIANGCKRKFKFTKTDIGNLWSDLLNDCIYISTHKSTFLHSSKLIESYQFQIFDSLIVATALEANCKTIFSEDMQHNRLIENKLTIINPFA